MLYSTPSWPANSYPARAAHLLTPTRPKVLVRGTSGRMHARFLRWSGWRIQSSQKLRNMSEKWQINRTGRQQNITVNAHQRAKARPWVWISRDTFYLHSLKTLLSIPEKCGMIGFHSSIYHQHSDTRQWCICLKIPHGCFIVDLWFHLQFFLVIQPLKIDSRLRPFAFHLQPRFLLQHPSQARKEVSPIQQF